MGGTFRNHVPAPILTKAKRSLAKNSDTRPHKANHLFLDQDNDSLGAGAPNTVFEGESPGAGNWVTNDNDECPNEAGPVSNNGCPEEIVAPPPPVEEEEEDICTGSTTGQYTIASPSTSQNYVLTKVYQDTGGSNALSSIQYYDGLGRPTQAVAVGAAPGGADLVRQQTYDAYGRADKAYLPTPMAGTAGSYRTAMETSAASHYGVNNPYSETVYEASPLAG